MNVTVIGTGYVGLVTGACLAQVGNRVLCLDVDEEKVATLNNGGVPIYEPGLEELLERNRADGRLGFTTDIESAVHHAKLQFIAVGTPPNGDGSADLKNTLAAAGNIGRYMTEPKIIIDKSTVPVGTADLVAETVRAELDGRGVNIEFSVVSNPEFLKEGAAIDDFMKPERIIIGTDDPEAIEAMRRVYAPLSRHHDKLIVMDTRSAELTKYAANAMLATRISFMNEMANLAEKLGADIEQIRRGIGSDSRIGYDFLYPGCGYGGSCLPKDIKALIHTANNVAGVELKVVQATGSANEEQKQLLGRKIRAVMGTDLSGKHFALWGLSFKPNTGDMREAPSRVLIDDLLNAGATITAYDPAAMDEARAIYNGRQGLSFAAGPMHALKDADALIIVTEWTEFRSPDFDKVKQSLQQPIIFDGRNLYEPRTMHDLGIEYHAIGRGTWLVR